MTSRRTHLVPRSARGERLDQYLAATFADLSRSRVKSLIDTGQISVDGRAPKASLRLKGGEHIEASVPPPLATEVVAEALPLRILYEDAQVAVVDKAPGMVVHPAAGHWSGTLVNALLHHLGQSKGVGSGLRPGLVHRLDKETSGCLVVAKTEAALVALQSAFKRGNVDKTYLALVHGHPKSQGKLETPFGRHPVHRKRFSGRVKVGKPALTLYRVVERLDGASLVEVRLLTGRTHQIRVHFSEMGHPLLADALYGKPRRVAPSIKRVEEALGRHALHAWRLSFPHPENGHRVSIEAPVPDDFEGALNALRPSQVKP